MTTLPSKSSTAVIRGSRRTFKGGGGRVSRGHVFPPLTCVLPCLPQLGQKTHLHYRQIAQDPCSPPPLQWPDHRDPLPLLNRDFRDHRRPQPGQDRRDLPPREQLL